MKQVPKDNSLRIAIRMIILV